MSYFGVVGALAMVVFGGIGVDMMYAEVKRTKLQNTLDRAVLAAADLDQTIDPQVVVTDYFDKMQLDDALGNIEVTEGIGLRRVTADGSVNMPAAVLQMLGEDFLRAEGVSTAQEGIGNIEISLVLDISGSMSSNSKIDNLKVAAKEFVDTVIRDDDAGLTTVSIVPYNATVNMGSTLKNYYTMSDEHDYSSCAIFPDSAFQSTGIDRNTELDKLSHFDRWTTNRHTTEIPSPWCAASDYGKIMVHSADKTALKNHIDSLDAFGNTAIDLGMKWGTALLDPGTQSVVNDMIGDGHIVPAASGRPYAFDEDMVLKIVVLMTDGKNTTQYDIKDEYKTGLSPIFLDDRNDSDPSNDRSSIRVKDQPGDNNDVYYWPAYRGGSWNDKYDDDPHTYSSNSNLRQLTWEEVFARWGTRAAAFRFYQEPYYDGWSSYSQYAGLYYAGDDDLIDGPEADARLSTVCQKARQAGITVFAIGFEAPQEGQDAMRDCASSPAHYFPVEGIEIADAFTSIARTINRLRLTQ
ncbi:hypothetical protein KUH32_11045 [Thalassococcus sp. CAU 1522]|uniref:Putative Flp pilus-assembly TadG-like N-terminal domain-containing protein n=1 Tax=Thalassococcus arenae TaxID=2851652 RepID=A0ABS6N8I3_9RHOB|nr:Tad domain-containing protein [Thalassococcus arenae]MBV2360314.1 hypothetical protein [Thalassococcus arenae]